MPDETPFTRDSLGPPGHLIARIPLGESTGVAGGGSDWWFLNPLSWFGREVTYSSELRYFNRFRREVAPAERREEKALTTQNPRRDQREGDSCWTEEQFTYRLSTRTKTLVLQYFETWTINSSLDSYYDTVLGLEGFIVSAEVTGGPAALAGMSRFAEAAASTAGRMGTTAAVSETTLAAAGTFLSGAAAITGMVGVGVLIFQGGTWMMYLDADHEAGGNEELVSSGWELRPAEYGEWEDAGTETRWEEVPGSRGPCPPDEENGGTHIPQGGQVSPPVGSSTVPPPAPDAAGVQAPLRAPVGGLDPASAASEEGGTGARPQPNAEREGDPAPNAPPISVRTLGAAATGVGIAVVVGGFLLFGGDAGGGNTAAADHSSSPSGDASSGSSSSSSASDSFEGAAETSAPSACEIAREEPLVLEVSSEDIVGGVIPEEYLRRSVYDNGFMTPRFSWSAVPPEATEVIILILKLEDEEFAEFMADPNPRAEAFRHGTERWVLNGLDPSITSLANTSLTVPPPTGAVEQTNQGPGVTPNGVASRSKFVGPGFPERHFVFAVFAVCEGGGLDRGTYRGFALAEDAVAYGWFFGEPPW